MRIDSIKVENYGSLYGEHTFKLSGRGLVLFEGINHDEPRMSSNGAGKSTLWDSLDWCLFGVVPRGDHADSIINEESKQCAVECTLYDDAGIKGVVLRMRGKSSALRFWISDAEVTALDTKETQVAIERYLGLDREVFHAAVLFGQTDMVHYAESTDAERMAILTRILQLDEIDEYLESVKTRMKAVREEWEKLEKSKLVLQGEVQSLSMQDFSLAIAEYERERQQRIQKMLEHKKVLQEQYASLEKQKAMLDVLDNQIIALHYKWTDANVTLDTKVVEGARNHLATVRENRAVANNAVIVKQSEKDQLHGLSAKCPRCLQTVPPEHIGREIQRVDQEIKERESVLATWTAEVARIESALSEVARKFELGRKAIEDNKLAISGELNSVQAQRKAVNDQLAALPGIQRQLFQLDLDIGTVNGCPNPNVAQAERVDARLLAVNGELGALEANQGKFQETLKYLEFWEQGFGPKGLKSFILDSRLQELSDATNHWVKLLTGGTIWVRFEAQKATRGGKVVNSPDIRVFRWNPDGTTTERKYRSWSGGEKQRVSFAVDFGLSRLVANRARNRYDIVILDEVFKHLDRAGESAVMEMLKELALEKSSLFVVEHASELQDQFENRVLAEKTNRRTVLREVTHVPENPTAQSAAKILDSGGAADSAPKPRPRRTPVRRPPAPGK